MSSSFSAFYGFIFLPDLFGKFPTGGDLVHLIAVGESDGESANLTSLTVTFPSMGHAAGVPL